MSTISRRQALGAAAAGLGTPVLAACGDDGTSAASDPTSPPASSATSSAAASPSGSPSAPPTTTSAPPAGGIPASDVPVGGGLVVAEEGVVLTQPTRGDFRAFSAVCTHQGCLVSRVEDGEIQCDCHGSRFSITDGSPTAGPAGAPLGPADISVDGRRITVR